MICVVIVDSETGLYNSRSFGVGALKVSRYYDPSLSLWLGVDPLADQFPGWSSYNYTMNNPINMIDPDGRAAVGLNGGPGDPPIGAVIGGTLKAGLLNLIGLGVKYSNTPRGMMMRKLGMSYHFSVREDPNSSLGVAVGGEIRFDQSVLQDAGNGALAAMDLAPLSPGKGGVAAFAKTPAPTGILKHIFGQDGVQIASKTVWKAKGSKARIDIENPNPGVRAGNIHYQDADNVKYMYDKSTGSFFGKNSDTGVFDVPAPNSVNNLLKDDSFSKGIDKGLRYLGEQ